MDLQMLNRMSGQPGLIQVGFTLLVVILIYNGLQNLFDKVTEKSSKATTTRRRLGKHEALMNLLSEERQGAADICLILSLRSETKLVKECVHNALVLLAKRQPMLRAIITTTTSDTEDKYFEIIDGDKISHMIDFTSSDTNAREWKDVCHEVASKPRETDLLWKAVILQEELRSDQANYYMNTLMFTFNHCCIDGVSSMKFCQQFLYYLNGLTEGSFTSDKVVSSLSLFPSTIDLLTRERPWSLWQFLATSLGIPHISKYISKTAVRWRLSRKQCNPFFVQFPTNRYPRPSNTPMTTEILSRVFTVIETSNIVKACRLNECTVTGALMAASHLAFCKLIQDGKYSCNDFQLEHHLAINGQRDCQPKPPKEYIGHFGGIHPLWIEYADDKVDFWQLAQESTKRIHFELKEEKYAKATVHLFNCFSTREVLNKLTCPLDDLQNLDRLTISSGVSSIGSFDSREKQKLQRYQLHECLIYSLLHDSLYPFFHYNTTVNGKISWIIAYNPYKIVNGAHAERFANLCFDYFIEMNQ